MSGHSNGGPAFPGKYVKHHPGEVGNNVAIKAQSEGMTLRDYFAATAPIGVADANDAFYRASGRNARQLEMLETLAKMRGRYADAMIAERAQDESHGQLVVALRDCVSVMDRELNGLAVIQPELRQAREALAAAGAA